MDLDNKRTIAERTTGGHAIKVVAGLGIGGAQLVSTIDGRYDAGQYSLCYRLPDAIKAKGYASSVGRVALTIAETEAAKAAMAALKAEREATPEGLRSRRQYLVETLASILDGEAADRDAAWEREDEARASTTPRKVRQDVAAARQAIRDFDVAHPEVLESIRRDERAAVERHMWD